MESKTLSLDTTVADVPQTLALGGGATMVLTRGDELSNLEFFDPTGRLTLSLLMTPEGPVLRIAGVGVKVDVEGDLSFSADQVKLTGRERVDIVSGGEFHLDVAGRAFQNARSHEMISELGDIRLKANDDVRLEGERVMVNCEANGT